LNTQKKFYGRTILNAEELEGIDRGYKAELEYYRVDNINSSNSVKEESILYGIEVVKKERLNDGNLNTEKNIVKYISQDKGQVDKMLKKLYTYQVTPVALENIIDDLKKE
jgi:hypothetical protein